MRFVGRGVLLALLGGSGLPAPLHATGPPCRVSVDFEPAEPYVGQQLRYRLHVLRRDDVRSVEWQTPPHFPAFRAESLPTHTDAEPVLHDGRRYLAFEERRALFPVRAGVLELPAASVRCMPEAEGADAFVAEATAASVRVRELPARGRPSDFAGLVGSIAVRVQAKPARARLGESMRLALVVEGDAELWRLADPLAPGAAGFEDAELLVRPPELARDAGGRLHLRRHFAYDLVPHRTGRFELPRVQVPYFDPVAERYAVATSEPLTLEVQAAAAPRPAATQPDRALPAPDGSPRSLRRWATAAGVAALAGLLLLAVRARRRREPWLAVGRALDEAAGHRATGDAAREAAALGRALRGALEARRPGARALTAQELAQAATGSPGLAEAADLLAALDAARFARESTHVPDAARLRRVIEALRSGG